MIENPGVASRKVFAALSRLIKATGSDEVRQYPLSCPGYGQARKGVVARP
jgi:hypothetical protein